MKIDYEDYDEIKEWILVFYKIVIDIIFMLVWIC